MKEKKFMDLQKHKKVIISGGGTGGHIFPAISIANALRKIDPDIGILFVGLKEEWRWKKSRPQVTGSSDCRLQESAGEIYLRISKS
jgi:hypothetical protein